MKPTPQMLSSIPFQYANDVRTGKILVGNRIKQAVERFYSWIKTAEKDGYSLDHTEGMFVVDFFPKFLNHTTGKLQRKPFHLAPFQQFTIYNVFAWKDKEGKRRIRTIYDKRAKKNGKSAEMAGIALYCMSVDFEMEAQIYIGATKEEQAKICWKQAAQFIKSPAANPLLKTLGFEVQQRIIHFHPTASVMQALGGDSKTQDGINAHLSIIDEYHAHKDDSVKENLESSSVQRLQPITWHITTAGTNIASVCKNYEDSVIEVLEGRKTDDHLWVMIHDLDPDDNWEDETVWYKANPLLGNGLEIDGLRIEYIKAQNQPSKIPNFKTKHLNMWVDAPTIWIPSEIWKRNKVKEIPLEKFEKFGCFAGLDLSSIADITALVLSSEPDEFDNRYIKTFFFCPEENVDRRSSNDRVPYRDWVDRGFMIATPGNRVDYNFILEFISDIYFKYNIIRIETDPWNASSLLSNMQEKGINVSELSQIMSRLSFPTKMVEKLTYDGKIKHDGNPVMEWMLSGCVIIEDSKGNIMIHKGKSHLHGKRIDGFAALINAVAGSFSEPEETSKYSKPLGEDEIYV